MRMRVSVHVRARVCACVCVAMPLALVAFQCNMQPSTDAQAVEGQIGGPGGQKLI